MAKNTNALTGKILYLTCIVLVGVFAFQPSRSSAQTNSVVGIVQDQQERALEDVEVFEIRHKDTVNDITNHNGLYCVKIPKSSPNYQLQFHKKDYMDLVDKEPIPNNVDPKKRDTIKLLAPSDLQTFNEPQLRKLIGVQLSTFKFGRAEKLPAVMKATGSNFQLIFDNINAEIKNKAEIRREIETYIREVSYELKKLQR